MKLLATKVFAVWLLVTLLERSVFGFDEETEEMPEVEIVEYDDEPGYSEILNDTSLDNSEQIKLAFEAFGKDFIATLNPENGIFADDAKVSIHGLTTRSLPIEKHYGGHLKGLDNTTVLGRFTRGVFDGVVFTDEDDYFVEPADRYFPTHPDYNAFVYRVSDALWPYLENAIPTTVNVTRRTRRTIDKIPKNPDKRSSSPVRVCTVKVAVDGAFYEHAGADHSSAVSEAQYYVAAANAVFRGLNVDFVVSGVEVFQSGGPANLSVLRPYFERSCVGLLLTRRNPPNNATEMRECEGSLRICSGCNAVAVSLLLPDGTPRSHQDTAALVAHHFGHLFGSPDDDRFNDTRCNPASPDERFVMSPLQMTRKLTNNLRFSECSLRSIGQFLREVDANGGCLTPHATNIKDISNVAAEAPIAEVSNNELPDAWSEHLAAKGSKITKRKKGSKVMKPKKSVIETTSSTATTSVPPETQSTTTTEMPQEMVHDVNGFDVEERAGAVTTKVAGTTKAAGKTKVAAPTTSAGTTKKAGKGSAVTHAAVKRPWKVMAATLVTFTAVGFRILG